MTRTLRRAIRVATALVAALMVTSGARVTAADEIGFSDDGVTWSTQLAEPLFDPAVRWVPGDTRTATFFVRNQTDDPALLAIDVIATDTGGLLATGAITITATESGSTMTRVDSAGTHRLVSDTELRSGAAADVAITVRFDPGSNDQTQALAFELQVEAILAQDTAALSPSGGDNPPVTPPDGSAPDLPTTGAAFIRPLAVAATVFLTLGSLTVAARRRRLQHG